MDREQLYQNLNELEKQLRGIQSATENVNKVIAQDRALVEAVRGYTAEAQKMLGSIQSVYDGEVAQIKEAAISVLNSSAEDFEKKVNSVAADLVENTKGLKTMVEETLTPLVKDNLVGLIDGNLKPFVTEQMPAKFAEVINQCKTSLSEIEQLTREASSELKNAAEIISERIVAFDDPIKSIASEIEKQTNIFSDIQTRVASLYDQMNNVIKSSGDAADAARNSAGKLDSLIKSQGDVSKDLKESIKTSEKALADYAGALKDNIAHTLGENIEETRKGIIDTISGITRELDSLQSGINLSLTAIKGDVSDIKTGLRPIRKIESDINSLAAEIAEIKAKASFNKKMTVISVILLCLVLLGEFLLLTKNILWRM